MQIIPAIDLIDGKCVRLRQGDYAQQTTYTDSPLDWALQLQDTGVERLHVVDLEGAKLGRVVHYKVLETLASKTNLVVDFGGGIKTDEAIHIVLESGAAMASIGSIAVKNPSLLNSWIVRYGADRIFLGADVRDELIAISGWLETTKIKIWDFLNDYTQKGIKNVFCTDIAKDGLMQEASVDLYKKILAQFPDLNLVASGGVAKMDDLYELKAAGCHGAIVGKALLEGTISMKELEQWHVI